MSLELTAQRLINAKGRTVTLTRAGTTLVNAATPWLGHTAGTTLALRAVFISSTEGELARTLFAALTSGGGAPPRRARETFMVAGLDLGSVDPKTIVSVTDGGTLWRVTGVETIKPGSILYAAMLEVRQ